MRRIIIISLLSLVACKTAKKSVETHTATIKDSVAMQATSHSKETHTERNTEKRDTIIGTPARTVISDPLPPDATDIPRTQSGKAVPRHYETKKDGVRVWVTVDTNNRITYGAEVDSNTYVIRALTSIIEKEKQSVEDSHRAAVAVKQVDIGTSVIKERDVNLWDDWIKPALLFIAIVSLLFAGLWFREKYLPNRRR